MTKEDLQIELRRLGARETINRIRLNTEFINDIYNADEDTPPKWYAATDEKLMFVAMYYGWLIAKYGANEWHRHF